MTVDHVSRLLTANVPGSPPIFQSKIVGKYVTILLTQVCPRHLPIITQKLITEKIKRDGELPPLIASPFGSSGSSSSSSSYLWFAVNERKEEVD
uniref:Uncharacterized protein n=1 Tax=Panagrolaimus davidi TaxID=227884 RepID=A0A914PCV8_9BILA